MHVIAAKAVCFKEAAEPGVRGLPAAGRDERRSAWPPALAADGFRLVSGGTDNHLMLVDVFSKGITGKEAEQALDQAGITVNKNAIPFDTNPPMAASGIRIGTPGRDDARHEGSGDGPDRRDSSLACSPRPTMTRVLAMVKAEVEALCRTFPLYPERQRSIDRPSTAVVRGRTGRSPRELAALRAARRPAHDGAAPWPTTLEHGGVLLAEAGNRHRQDAGLPGPGHPQRPARARLHRHQEPAGADLLQGPAGPAAARSGVPFTATYMKGRANYLCLHRLRARRAAQRPGSVGRPAGADRAPGPRPAETGDRAELEDLPGELAALERHLGHADTCLGSECPQYQECFVTRMRQRAAASDLVIVNHHLLCADAAVRQGSFGEVIPGLPLRRRRRGAPARGRGHAVLRHRRQQLPGRRSRARRRAGAQRRRGRATTMARCAGRCGGWTITRARSSAG